MRLAIKTFGCKANSTDTDFLFLEAKERGFEVVSEGACADAFIINSCTVTDVADHDARLEAIRFKKKNPLSLVAVIGCYAQVAKDELLALPEVDFVVGTANKLRVLDHLNDAWLRGNWRRDQVEAAKGFLPEKFRGSRQSRATIKIQDGCNFSCSFCIIPQARGRSRSLAMNHVLSQVEEAHHQGFREVVLTGIHLAHYGWDIGTNLLSLLKRLFERPDGPRVRLSTLDPFEIPDELISLLGEEDRLCPHFHIALQSGSDQVLSAMRRIYKAEEFVTVTKKIQQKNPDTFIGVDVIVGFPGETDEDFSATVSILEESFWAKLHVFPYSAREGTKAPQLGKNVPGQVISARAESLLKMSDERYGKFLSSQIGATRSAILEKPSRTRPDFWQAHTENYVPVYVRAENLRPKSQLSVRLGQLAGSRVLATRLTGSIGQGQLE